MLIHGGDVHAGHYWVYQRHQTDWLHFDDDQVRKASKEEWVQDGYGGTYETGPRQGMMKRTNAYMLVYVRKDWMANGICWSDVVPPDHLLQRKEEERLKEERIKEQERTKHLYTKVQLASIQDYTSTEEIYTCALAIPIKWKSIDAVQYKKSAYISQLCPDIQQDDLIQTLWLKCSKAALQCIDRSLTLDQVLNRCSSVPTLKFVTIPLSQKDYDKALDSEIYQLVLWSYKGKDSRSFTPLSPIIVERRQNLGEMLKARIHLPCFSVAVAKRQSRHHAQVLDQSKAIGDVVENGEVTRVM